MNIVYKLIYVFSWHCFYTSSCANFAHTDLPLRIACIQCSCTWFQFFLLSSGLLPLISWMLTLYPETLLNSFISGYFVDLLLFYVCITMSLNKNSSASSILGNPFACVFFCRWVGTGVGVHSLALLWLWRTFSLYCCDYGDFPGHLQQREVSSAPSLLRDAVFFFIINEYWICKKKKILFLVLLKCFSFWVC